MELDFTLAFAGAQYRHLNKTLSCLLHGHSQAAFFRVPFCSKPATGSLNPRNPWRADKAFPSAVAASSPAHTAPLSSALPARWPRGPS